MKRKILIPLFVVLAAIIGCGIYLKNSNFNTTADSVSTNKVKKRKLNNKVIPTFFFHGASSSYRAEEHMANAAVKAGAADQIIRANVFKNDKVTLIGKLRKNIKHPIIEVNYANNYSVNPDDVKAALVAVQNKYSYHKVNLVGHSMGNLLIAHYLNENYANKSLPQVQKVVSIAGYYNGWLGEGEEATSALKKNRQPIHEIPSFKTLLGLRKHYPKQIKVLNIYGDLQDGSRSDGSVAVSSAKSYKYLINGRAKSYREVEIKGKQAQHSRLHRNAQVDRLLIKFLWKK